MKLELSRVLLAGFVVLGLAACGDNTPTKADFIAEGDAVCRKGDAKMDPLFEELFSGGGPDPEKLEELLPKIGRELRAVSRDLGELEGPADGEKVVADSLKDMNKGIASIDAAAKEAATGNENAGETLFAGFENFEKADEKARAYGFKVCGSEDAEEEEGSGEDEDAAPVDVPADQQAFIDQGDAICKKALDQLEPLFGQLFGSANMARRAEALGKVIPLIREQNEALKALTPPAAIQDQMKEITTAYDANLVKAEEVKAIAESGDKAKYDAEFEKLGMSFDEADAEFEKLGFKECGE